MVMILKKAKIIGITIFENETYYYIDFFRNSIEENQLYDNTEELKQKLLENFKKGLDKMK